MYTSIKTFPPPPPPSLWRVTTPAGEIDVTATFASVTPEGTFGVSRQRAGQLVRDFVESRWLLVEQIIGDR